MSNTDAPSFVRVPHGEASADHDWRRVFIGRNMDVLDPIFQIEDSVENIKARDLLFEQCPKKHAVEFVRKYHSRLSKCQSGPWMFAFRAKYKNTTVAVALWNNPSTRSLPNNWLELRRLACSPNSPHNTCSRFISFMVNFFKNEHKNIEKLISYQDTAVHTGTIYKASNWFIDFIGIERERDRSKVRTGTNRFYRKNINGTAADKTKKIRWAYILR